MNQKQHSIMGEMPKGWSCLKSLWEIIYITLKHFSIPTCIIRYSCKWDFTSGIDFLRSESKKADNHISCAVHTALNLEGLFGKIINLQCKVHR